MSSRVPIAYRSHDQPRHQARHHRHEAGRRTPGAAPSQCHHLVVLDVLAVPRLAAVGRVEHRLLGVEDVVGVVGAVVVPEARRRVQPARAAVAAGVLAVGEASRGAVRLVVAPAARGGGQVGSRSDDDVVTVG